MHLKYWSLVSILENQMGDRFCHCGMCLHLFPVEGRNINEDYLIKHPSKEGRKVKKNRLRQDSNSERKIT